LIETFGRTMRENLTRGLTPFRKAYLRSMIDVIEVDDTQIRIKAAGMCWNERFWPAGLAPNRVR